MSENAKAAKQQRLAQALRANLKRRKDAAGRAEGASALHRPEAGAEAGEPVPSLSGETGHVPHKD